MPEQIEAIIEIPQGSRNKYEYDHTTHAIRLDRVLHSSVHYPTDYGFMPDTISKDGDPLDVLVVVYEPTFPGCHVPVRIIGLLRMQDEKGEDEKILAVPVGDPRLDGIDRLDGFPPTRPDEQPRIFPVPWHAVTPDWAWGGSTGKAIKVCIVDSGIEADHPALGGMVRGGVIVERGTDGLELREEPHGDLFGHATACAGIIHHLAPEAELYSARVLGPNLKGGGDALVAGVQ